MTCYFFTGADELGFDLPPAKYIRFRFVDRTILIGIKSRLKNPPWCFKNSSLVTLPSLFVSASDMPHFPSPPFAGPPYSFAPVPYLLGSALSGIGYHVALG